MKKRINKVKFTKTLIFLFCVILISHNIYMLTLYNLITNKFWSWSWYDLLIFIVACMTAYVIFNDFKEQIKKMSTTRNSQHLK